MAPPSAADPRGDISVVAAPVLPVSSQRTGLQPPIRRGGRRDQPRQPLVVMHEPRQTAARQFVQMVRSAPVSIGQRIETIGVGEREIDVHARPACLGNRFRHEGQNHPVVQRYLARQQAEKYNVVNCFDGIVKGQRIFKLGRVVFAGDHVQLKSQPVSDLPDPVVEPQRIGERPGPVNHAARRVIGVQPPSVVGHQREGFQFDPHLWGQPARLPIGHGAFQRPAWAQRQRNARVVIKIAEHNLGKRFPAHANLIGLPAQFHIGQAFHHHRAGCRQQIAVVMHAERLIGRTACGRCRFSSPAGICPA